MKAVTRTLRVQVALEGRDEIELELDLEGDRVGDARVRGRGCPRLLEELDRLRELFCSQVGGSLKDLPVPEGEDHASMMARELVLKAKGEWKFPYTDLELCHCRAVPTERVDQSVVGGALTREAVSRQTSAGTACGTCRPDIEQILAFRRKSCA